MKKFYAFAWFLLAAAAIATALTGAFDAAALVIFSLIALGLVYALAFWSVIVNTRQMPADENSFSGL